MSGPQCFRWYDLPDDRTWESFRFLVEAYDGDGQAGRRYDALVTDDPTERDRIAKATAGQGYYAHVIDRSAGEVVVVEPEEDP